MKGLSGLRVLIQFERSTYPRLLADLKIHTIGAQMDRCWLVSGLNPLAGCGTSPGDHLHKVPGKIFE